MFSPVVFCWILYRLFRFVFQLKIYLISTVLQLEYYTVQLVALIFFHFAARCLTVTCVAVAAVSTVIGCDNFCVSTVILTYPST